MIKSLFVFFQNKLSKAEEYLENIQETDQQSLPFLLSKGAIFFHKRDYHMAHRLFLLAFKLYGRYFALLKYILGLCNFFLEDYQMAERCLLFYLDSVPRPSVFCLSTLAVLYMKTNQHVKYQTTISKAFEEGEQQKIFEMNVMVNLAEHFVFSSDFESAEKIARMALRVNFDGRRRLIEEGSVLPLLT